ncbi:MAG: trypsin-like peptidase domain-containing protein [Oscillospiraceae bacterium]|nr:trypsin-like peptidase domain-containing protein [Oscillospiraceae bacterium]
MKADRYHAKSAYWDDPWDEQPQREPDSQDERFARPQEPEEPIDQTEPTPPEDGADGTPPPYVYPAPEQRKKRRKWPYVLLVAVILALFFSFGTIYVLGPYLEISSVSGSGNGEIIPLIPDEDEEDEDDGESEVVVETSSDEEDEAQCYLERAETGTGVTLELYSREGQEELTYEEIYARNIEAVVSIICYQDDISGTSGTGIIFSSDGYIVTNEHVIEDAVECYVILEDGSYYTAMLVGMDEESDLAVLKIDATGLTTAQFGDSDELVVGNACVAIGNPLGETFRGTMTTGIISALNRNVEVNGYTMTLIQTDCAINSGNSGGPLIDMYGQVVGICNMKMMSTETTVEGLGFAIPSNTIKTVVNKLIATGEVEKAMLGITASTLTTAQCQMYGIDNGILVAEVSQSSDAYAQGIQTGDIIVAANGTPISTVNELNALKGDMYPGDSIVLTVLRDGVYTDYTVILMSEDDVY